MHLQFSIIIITHNEAHIIAKCLQSVKNWSNDIVVLDSQSTDNTVDIATKNGARVINVVWQGYGATKNAGHIEARHDWILSLDADEIADATLINFVQQWKPNSISDVLVLQRYLVWEQQILKFGSNKELKIRLFNRKNAHWNTNLVHENLEFKKPITQHIAQGKLLHYSFKNAQDARQRLTKYAILWANQKKENGKKTYAWMPYIQWIVVFTKNYLIRLGFLDGNAGLAYAKETARYCYKKYVLLLELNKK